MKPVIELRQTIGVLSFFAFVAFVGVALGAVAVNDFAQARASVHWRTVDGVILSGAPPNEPGKLRYAYYHDGRNIESGRIRFLSARFTPLEDTYAAGQHVRVRISPKDPEQSVLSPGGSGRAFAAALAFSAVLTFVGLGGFVRALTPAAVSGKGSAPVSPDPAY